MREVDARGLSCPEPLMLTAEAIKSDNSPVKVLVTEPHQKTNVEKFAKDHGKKTTVEEIEDGFVTLEIRGRGQKTDFYYKVQGKEKMLLVSDVDMTGLSTELAGGFTGCCLGMYASSNGEISENHADFAWMAIENQ